MADDAWLPPAPQVNPQLSGLLQQLNAPNQPAPLSTPGYARSVSRLSFDASGNPMPFHPGAPAGSLVPPEPPYTNIGYMPSLIPGQPPSLMGLPGAPQFYQPPGYPPVSYSPWASEPAFNPWGQLPQGRPTGAEQAIAHQLVDFGPPWYSSRQGGQPLNYTPSTYTQALPQGFGGATGPDLSSMVTIGGHAGNLGQALASRNRLDQMARGLAAPPPGPRFQRVENPQGGYTYRQVP